MNKIVYMDLHKAYRSRVKRFELDTGTTVKDSAFMTGQDLLSDLVVKPDIYALKLQQLEDLCRSRMFQVRKKACHFYFYIPSTVGYRGICAEDRKRILHDLQVRLDATEGIRAIKSKDKAFTLLISWAPT